MILYNQLFVPRKRSELWKTGYFIKDIPMNTPEDSPHSYLIHAIRKEEPRVPR